MENPKSVIMFLVMFLEEQADVVDELFVNFTFFMVVDFLFNFNSETMLIDSA